MSDCKNPAHAELVERVKLADDTALNYRRAAEKATERDQSNTQIKRKLVDRWNRARALLNADSLFLKIGHGDQEHQDWLKSELYDWFTSRWVVAAKESRQIIENSEDRSSRESAKAPLHESVGSSLNSTTAQESEIDRAVREGRTETFTDTTAQEPSLADIVEKNDGMVAMKVIPPTAQAEYVCAVDGCWNRVSAPAQACDECIETESSNGVSDE